MINIWPITPWAIRILSQFNNPFNKFCQSNYNKLFEMSGSNLNLVFKIFVFFNFNCFLIFKFVILKFYFLKIQNPIKSFKSSLELFDTRIWFHVINFYFFIFSAINVFGQSTSTFLKNVQFKISNDVTSGFARFQFKK